MIQPIETIYGCPRLTADRRRNLIRVELGHGYFLLLTWAEYAAASKGARGKGVRYAWRNQGSRSARRIWSEDRARRTGGGGRRTGYDVGEGRAGTAFSLAEAGRRTGFDLGEAGRETEFNQKAVDDLWQRFMAKLAYALEASKYQIGTGQSFGSGESMGGNFSIAKLGGD